MLKSGLYNNVNKCWLNSMMQLLCSIQEIDKFFYTYTGNDKIILKLKELNNIINYKKKISEEEQKKIKDYIISNIKPPNKSEKFNCDTQQDPIVFLNIFYVRFLDQLFKKLFENTNKRITLFNKNINDCKTNYIIEVQEGNYVIHYYEINNTNNNIIDKIYLKEEIKDQVMNCDTEQKILIGTKILINYREPQSKYILINYITYTGELINGIFNGDNAFKPIKLYKRFSINDNNYIIKGIIKHSGGNSINSGHYYYLEYETDKDKWIIYDDTHIKYLQNNNNNLDSHRGTEIIISDNNIYYFDNQRYKPVIILYKKVETHGNESYKKIDFNFNDHIKERQLLVNNYQDIEKLENIIHPDEDFMKAIEESLKDTVPQLDKNKLNSLLTKYFCTFKTQN